MKLIWATGSHRGLIRDSNQDQVYPEGAGSSAGDLVIAVADGMGGHAGGEEASRIAIERATGSDAPELVDRVRAAHRAVLETAIANPSLAGMGSTLTMAEFADDGSFQLAHVGDSRAYLLHDGSLRQLTSDHTLVAQWIADGRLTPAQAATHPQRSIITRAIGYGDPINVDLIEERLEPGDRLLLCSDGVSGMIDDGRIGELLSAGTAEDAVWALIEAANKAGGYDNITVAIVDRSS